MNSFGSILAKHRKQLKLTQPMVVERLADYGLKTSFKALSTWEQDKTQPSLQEFFALCQILEIKDIYEEVFGTNPYSLVKDLSDEGREKVDDYIELLRSSGKYRRPVAQIIPIRKDVIRLYKTPVSAGTGNFLESTYYEDIERDEFIPKNATFGVIISGDSMMPKYKDGQTVWVEQDSMLANGEIGIFLLDGNAYCKKFNVKSSGAFLESLNKKYAPIPISEDNNIHIFGRVLN